MSAPVVGFAGLTHLGLVSAIAVASKGFRVIGYDADAARVHDIAAGQLPVVEPDLDELARGVAGRITFTSQAGDLAACDVVYISTDVATDARGESDLSAISALITDVIAALASHASDGRAVPGAAGLHPPFAASSGASVLSGRDLGVWTRGRAGDTPGALHGRVRGSRQTPAQAVRDAAWCLWLSDPAHALRERGACKNRDQLLPRGLGHRCQYAGGTLRAHRRGLERDHARAQARRPDRATRLSGAWIGARRRQSRARSCHHHTPRCGHRVRGERHCRLHCQQPASARLGAAGAPRRGARAQAGCTHRHSWPGVQGKHPLDQELTLACADLGARSLGGSSSTIRSFRPRPPPTRAPTGASSALAAARVPMRSPS